MNLEIYESQLNIAQKAIDNQIIEYSKKINDNPNDFKSLTELIFISLESKQLESALELIEWAFQIHPHSLDLYSAKIQALLQSGRLKEAKIQIYKFIKCYKLDKEYKRNANFFFYLACIAETIFNDLKLSEKLISISIREFPNDFRGQQQKILIEIYHYGNLSKGRKALKNLIEKYNNIDLVESYILTFQKDNPPTGLSELKRFYPKFKNEKVRLVYLEYKLISTFYDKAEIIYFLDKNMDYITGNYRLYEKLCLGCLGPKDLQQEKLESDYNNFLFKYKYQSDLNSRYLYFKDFILSLILLSKKNEFDKNFREEIHFLGLSKIEFFQNKYKSLPSQSDLVKQFMPMRMYKHHLKLKNNYQKDKFIDYSVSPIFIVGLPRTGSTLVEKIIQNPKEIFDCDESDIVNTFIHDQDLINNNSLYDFYCKHFSELKNFKRFTDKSLQNFVFMDFIISIFPKAKFIHCTRDIKENIIGIFKQQFDNVPWAHTIEDILEYTDEYLKLMKILNKKYKTNILEINYSNLITNKEKETKKLFNFLNLKWSNKIFDFSTKSFFTNTSSKHQIKEGINKKHLNKYYDYYFVLDKFKEKYSWLDL